MRGWVYSSLLTATILGCAVPVPPSGGPEDTTPPEVVATSPALGETGVDTNAVIGISFSEKMTRTNLERLLKFYPPVPIGEVKWKGETILIAPSSPLASDTTYVVVLSSGFRDQHRVANNSAYTFAFSTGAAVDSGRVRGRVFYRRKPTSKGVVRLLLLPRDSLVSPAAAKPDREQVVSEDGAYALEYLPMGKRMILWAFQDGNGNHRYEEGREHSTLYPDTVTLSPGRPVWEEVDLYIVDPNEPGTVRGVVRNDTGIEGFPLAAALFAAGDSVRARYYTVCKDKGSFAITGVKRGTYVLRAFVDVAIDSTCGEYPCFADTSRLCPEPCFAYPDSIRIEPGALVEVGELVLTGEEGG